MKKRMILPVLALSLAAMLLATGCSNNKTPPSAGGSSQVEDMTPDSGSTAEPGVETTGEATTLAGLLGKTDADVTAVYGEGTPSQDEAGSVTAREYATTLFEKNAQLSFGYEEGSVYMISVYAEENDFAYWEEQLTAELGAPSSDSQNNDEGSDTKEKVWSVDGTTLLSLKEAYGALSLEVFRGA